MSPLEPESDDLFAESEEELELPVDFEFDLAELPLALAAFLAALELAELLAAFEPAEELALAELLADLPAPELAEELALAELDASELALLPDELDAELPAPELPELLATFGRGSLPPRPDALARAPALARAGAADGATTRLALWFRAISTMTLVAIVMVSRLDISAMTTVACPEPREWVPCSLPIEQACLPV